MPISPLPSLTEQSYAALRDRLVTLRIAPGSPLNEEAIMRELGVGRTPVREALRRLALEDLVVVHPRRGTFATEINLTDLAQISDLREQLEGHAALRAAERATDADRADIETLLADLDAAVVDRDLIALDARVHRFLYRCARNAYLESAADRFLNLSLRIWHLVLDQLPRVDAAVNEHRALLEAVRDGDGERARELAAGHVAQFAAEVRRAL